MIFLNGRLVGPRDARIDPRDRGLLLGDGLFETLLCRSGRPLDLAPHYRRLATGARKLGIPLALTEDEAARAIANLLDAEALTDGTAALRITLTRGPGARGLLPPRDSNPTVMISAEAWSRPVLGPAAAVIAAGVRRNEHSPCASLKTLNYLDNVMARREAEERGADEALMLNTEGRLSCGSASNLFLVLDERLATPPLADGALPGITRAEILEMAPRLGIEVEERPLPAEALAAARGLFVTNSLIGLRRVASVDGEVLGAGDADPRVSAIEAALEDARAL